MSYKIAVDAMGGDNAPTEIIKGAIMAMKEDRTIEIIFVGDEDIIRNELKENGYNKEVTIVHTDQSIAMDESPKKALQEKPKASIVEATRLLHRGDAEALVSSGSTGATILAAAQNLDMVEGLERSGLAAIYPTARFDKSTSGVSLILDVGATLHCSSKQLIHFAFMGSYYVSHILGIENPRVALLNIGEEETKGGQILTTTYRYLKNIENINFIGNVEGKDIPYGVADVVVTDGFVGNIALKMMEGVGSLLKQTGKYAFKKKLTWKLGLVFLASGLKRLKQKTDYSEYGGAPILGFEKLVIKAHGRSNAKAISNAIKVAKRSIEEDICTHISDSIIAFNKKHKIDFLDI